MPKTCAQFFHLTFCLFLFSRLPNEDIIPLRMGWKIFRFWRRCWKTRININSDSLYQLSAMNMESVMTDYGFNQWWSILLSGKHCKDCPWRSACGMAGRAKIFHGLDEEYHHVDDSIHPISGAGIWDKLSYDSLQALLQYIKKMALLCVW